MNQEDIDNRFKRIENMLEILLKQNNTGQDNNTTQQTEMQPREGGMIFYGRGRGPTRYNNPHPDNHARQNTSRHNTPRDSYTHRTSGTRWRSGTRNGRMSEFPRPRDSSYRGRRPHPYQQQNPRTARDHGPQANTTDNEFSVLCKKFFQRVQLQRASNIWTQLPRTLADRIDELVDSIRLPMPDDTILTDGLLELKNSFKSATTALAQDHLQRKQIEVDTQVKQMNGSRKVEATNIARSYIRSQFGRKISYEESEKWLQEGLELVGTEHNHATNFDMESEFPPIQAETQQRPNKRRIDTRTPPTETSNRFEALPVEMTTTEEIEETPETIGTQINKRAKVATPTNRRPPVVVMQLPEDSSNDLPAPPAPRSPTLLNNTPTVSTSQTEQTAALEDPLNQSIVSDPGTLRSTERHEQIPTGDKRLSLTPPTVCKPIIHQSTNKLEWNLTMPMRDTKIFVIADSNFRNITSLPTSWEIHVFPGMKLEQAIQLVNSINIGPHHIDHILVSVGINNRNYSPVSSNAELGKLYAALSRGNYKGHFLGVSIPRSLPKNEQSNLLSLNQSAARKFQPYYIQPLLQDQVSVSPTDKFQIHYDIETLVKISSKINAYFLRIQRLLTGTQ